MSERLFSGPFRRVRDASAVLGFVLVAAFLLRIVWLNQPTGSLIFDENYYVNAARVMAGIQPDLGSTYFYAPLHLDPNTQHPPLGKAFMVASMFVFGDNGIGWRLPSVLCGMIGLLAVYGIVRALGGRPWLAVLTVAIYALDVLTFDQSRMGMLDMMSLALILVGAWLGLRKHWLLAGTLVALGALVKLSGVFGLLALLLWQAVALWQMLQTRRIDWRADWRALLPTAQLVGAFVVIGLVGLWLLDLRFTQYTNPFDHLAEMLRYGFSLQSGSPDSQTSTPWEWLVGGGQFNFLKTPDSLVDFRAAINPVLLGSLALIVPFGAWAAWRRHDPVAGFALVWAGATFLPYVALAAIANRVMFLYYFLPAIPALAMLAAVFICRAHLPRPVVWAYLGAMLVGFLVYFPFRALPI